MKTFETWLTRVFRILMKLLALGTVIATIPLAGWAGVRLLLSHRELEGMLAAGIMGLTILVAELLRYSGVLISEREDRWIER